MIFFEHLDKKQQADKEKRIREEMVIEFSINFMIYLFENKYRANTREDILKIEYYEVKDFKIQWNILRIPYKDFTAMKEKRQFIMRENVFPTKEKALLSLKCKLEELKVVVENIEKITEQKGCDEEKNT